MDVLLLRRGRSEIREVLEVREQRKADLRTHRRDLQFRHYQSQVFDSSDTSSAAIANEACGLVYPFTVEKIDRILKGPGCSVVLFRCDKDISIE